MQICIKKPQFEFNSEGRIQMAILAIMIFFGLFLTGSLFVKTETLNPTLAPQANAQCCDTGNGPDCKPQTGSENEITYNGQVYGKIKSNVIPVEGNIHLKDTGQRSPSGEPIIVNSSDSSEWVPNPNPACQPNDQRDKYLTKYFPLEIIFDVNRQNEILPFCASLPNDQIIYVCKKNCAPSVCMGPYANEPQVSCYGSTDSLYDVYFRMEDYQREGVPDLIAKCDLTNVPNANAANPDGEQEIIFNSDPSGKQNLQLDTFTVKEDSGYSPWLSPFCKPAIYLYPEEKRIVNVKVEPVGKMTYTIPLYPKNGWTVLAHPNGDVLYQGKIYDYLYYEAEIPDSYIQEPKEGYVVEYKKLEELFDTLLPKLGLNEKEATQFREYWLEVLPNAPYYSVKIISEKNLDEIAPLSFSIQPDSIKRVTLSFAPHDEKFDLPEPIILPFKRIGFTVIEWGGLFKRNDTYNFSCFM